MEIRFRIPMGAIYCAVVVCVMLLGGVCISQKVSSSRLMSHEPSDRDLMSFRGLSMPMACAVLMMFGIPTSIPTLTAMVLMLLANAVRKV